MNVFGRRTPFVVDTNILVVANRKQAEPLACANSCAQVLFRIKQAGLVVLDDGGRIWKEYRRYLAHSGQPGIGDSFFRWLFNNRARGDLVVAVSITSRDEDPSDFLEFPNSLALQGFDRADRKFVAVARSHGGNPAILNATDRDWWDYRDALLAVGITIQFVCPEQFRRTDD